MRKKIHYKKDQLKRMGEYKITYLDEAEYTKLLKGLKEINMLAYKDIIFKKKPFNTEPGKHELILTTDDDFKKVHGEIKLIYSTYKDTIVIENIEPSEVLMEYHKARKNTYKGIPFIDKKDLFKINLIKEMKK